jgi:phosphotransferase system enzyme I (PtsI)
MSSSAIQKVKRQIVHLNRSDCKALAERILDMDTPAEVRAALEAY